MAGSRDGDTIEITTQSVVDSAVILAGKMKQLEEEKVNQLERTGKISSQETDARLAKVDARIATKLATNIRMINLMNGPELAREWDRLNGRMTSVGKEITRVSLDNLAQSHDDDGRKHAQDRARVLVEADIAHNGKTAESILKKGDKLAEVSDKIGKKKGRDLDYIGEVLDNIELKGKGKDGKVLVAAVEKPHAAAPHKASSTGHTVVAKKDKQPPKGELGAKDDNIFAHDIDPVQRKDFKRWDPVHGVVRPDGSYVADLAKQPHAKQHHVISKIAGTAVDARSPVASTKGETHAGHTPGKAPKKPSPGAGPLASN